MARMNVLTTDGLMTIDVPDEWDRSLIGSYWNAVQVYMKTGRTDWLDFFDGQGVGSVKFETDPDEIDAWWSRGQLDFLEIYEG